MCFLEPPDDGGCQQVARVQSSLPRASLACVHPEMYSYSKPGGNSRAPESTEQGGAPESPSLPSQVFRLVINYLLLWSKAPSAPSV